MAAPFSIGDLLNGYLGPALAGLLAAGGGGAAVAVAVFRGYGTKWLDARFQHGLETMKHEQQVQVEHLRYEISGLLDRTVKLNSREFDVLPETWAKLSDAHMYVRIAVIQYIQHGDISGLSSVDLEDFLASQSMSESEANRIRMSPDRNRALQEHLIWKQKKAAGDHFNDFRMTLRKNRIFLEQDISKQFFELDELMIGALVELSVNQRVETPIGLRYLQEGDNLVQALGDAVQARLWNARSSQSIGQLHSRPT